MSEGATRGNLRGDDQEEWVNTLIIVQYFHQSASQIFQNMWLTLICQRASGLFVTVSMSRPVGVHLSSRGSWHSRAVAYRKVARTNRGSSKTHSPSTNLTKDTEEEWKERLIIYNLLAGLKFNPYHLKPNLLLLRLSCPSYRSSDTKDTYIDIINHYITTLLIYILCDMWNNISRAPHCDLIFWGSARKENTYTPKKVVTEMKTSVKKINVM